MAYYQDQTPTGTMDGSNVTFTLASTAIEIDNVYLNSGQVLDYVWNGTTTITMPVAPVSGNSLTVSYWTLGQVGDSTPYELPSTLSELLYRVRTFLGEQYSEEWSDRMITDWLNEAINKICRTADFPFMESEATIYLQASREEYQLPAGFKKMIEIYSKETSSADAALWSYSDSREGLSSPNLVGEEMYTVFGDALIIPSPTAAAQLKVRYYRYLPYFIYSTTTTRSKIPRQYEDLLVNWAVSRGKQQEEMFDSAREFKALFDEGIVSLILDTTRRIDKKYPRIQAMENYY